METPPPAHICPRASHWNSLTADLRQHERLRAALSLIVKSPILILGLTHKGAVGSRRLLYHFRLLGPAVVGYDFGEGFALGGAEAASRVAEGDAIDDLGLGGHVEQLLDTLVDFRVEGG